MPIFSRFIVGLLILWSLSLPLSGQTTSRESASSGETTDPGWVFHASSSLVLVNVFAINTRTKQPLAELDRSDLEVTLDDAPVSMIAFERAAHSETRPLVLWFVLVCHQQESQDQSSFIKGKAGHFHAALKNLEPRDTVGVAHWCGDGTSAIDLAPTFNRDAPLEAIERLFHGKPIAASTDWGKTETALKESVGLMLEQTHRSQPHPLPVLVFLYTDEFTMSQDTKDAVTDHLLRSTGIAYGIRESTPHSVPPQAIGPVTYVTAGEYFTVSSLQFGSTLETICRRLHTRYEVAFKPPAKDDRHHEGKIMLSETGKKKFSSGEVYYNRRTIDIKDTESAH